ncbi:hypothetical protein L1D34_26730 [Vibrio mediterranei]|jgi:DNA polymerase V|uniref:Y-family DNA polymerase n=1 Tax=Vibrio mediterranei TaxID=689 RepID=UPI001EFEB5A4|nr:hypothetical protein [Vibrio mediterranei]MCG9628414.1 hypothetical protein [Vibrio mediterranei]MCY9855110.1 hypothetical protein [Vibrio mediterranei]
MILLIDVHAMYVSNEAVFNPVLRTSPAVVLSNGDGIVVAANRQAKAAGVQKSKPVFSKPTFWHTSLSTKQPW